MQCKFLDHGLAVTYNHSVMPCCTWERDKNWSQSNQINTVELVNWFSKEELQTAKETLARNEWPASCKRCEIKEAQGRHDSMRYNGNFAYSEYAPGDITLEIRPGNTCNFACQTCWPEASSRVANYYAQAGLISLADLDSRRIDNFDFLLPVASRIKNVVLLGGEPFYDKACLGFIKWAQQNLTSDLIVFTNGSVLDLEFLQTYKGKLIIVFSLDAVGRPAEYIRLGTVWSDVERNYQLVKSMHSVEVRVNITSSVYNYAHLEQLIDYLILDWPSVVTFGTPIQHNLLESVIPESMRKELIESMLRIISKLMAANIESGQKANAVNAIKSLAQNLQSVPWSEPNFSSWIKQTNTMDKLKGAYATDYCGFLQRLLEYKVY